MYVAVTVAVSVGNSSSNDLNITIANSAHI